MPINQDGWLGRAMRRRMNGTSALDQLISAPAKISDALDGKPKAKPTYPARPVAPKSRRQINGGPNWPGATPGR